MVKTEKIVARALLFSLGAALVVLAFAYVVVSAVDLVTYGGIYLDYDDWWIMGGAFLLSFLGFLFMSFAKMVIGSESSGGKEGIQ